MTLIDSSQAILMTAQKVLKSFKVDVDEEIIAQSVGFPIKDSFKEWIGKSYQDAYEMYVTIYQRAGHKESQALTGAKELLLQLIEEEFKVVIITAKNQRSAEVELRYLAIPFCEVIGSSFREGKTKAMKKTKCIEYVGDHIEDYKAARGAGIHFLGVATNPTQKLELKSHGKFQVISNLNEFWTHSILK